VKELLSGIVCAAFGGGMEYIMKFNKTKNTVITNKTTIIRNGKVISTDDPMAAETMAKMQKKFGKLLNNGFFAEGITDTDDEADLSELQENLAGLSEMGLLPGFGAGFSMQSPEEETKVIQCKSCGANNTVVLGNITECDYCGSGLQY
jgi:hypothetical protein